MIIHGVAERMLFQIEFSTYSSIEFLSRAALFWLNMKWALKSLSEAITDSPVLKMFQQQMQSVQEVQDN